MSWRDFEARHQPDYPDPAALAAATRELAAYPPLVRLADVDALKAALAEAQRGRAFLLQGGDCAESFADFSTENIVSNFSLIAAMAERLCEASGAPVIRLARMAGQFAKPRSAPVERRGGVALPAYQGDIVNGLGFDARSRQPDPERMFRAYAQAAATLGQLARLAAGTSFWTSHEALLLPFEEALVRSELGRSYASSAHFLWIGHRTLFEGSAHVEFVRGLANPVGIKCGPGLAPDALLRLLDRIDPAGEPGRITLIVRMGAGAIGALLAPLLAAVAASGRPVLWASDPMHGNTRLAAAGKTRPMAAVRAELEAFFAIMGDRANGLHVEMTGADVAECSDGAAAPAADRYRSQCDPRLNPRQAMAVAGQVAERLSARIPVFA
jgi:3-deoxy-7-phosphoheptulonate synthase